jgi:hypothetical protein
LFSCGDAHIVSARLTANVFFVKEMGKADICIINCKQYLKVAHMCRNMLPETATLSTGNGIVF